MTRKVILRKASSDSHQFLLGKDDLAPRNHRFGEVAGKTTADCAALCCCCPCGLANLVVLAVYKLPTGLAKKALKKKKQQKRITNEGLLVQRRCGCDKSVVRVHPMSAEIFEVENVEKINEEEVMELEKEMWEKFYKAGFWRSISQRD